MWEICRCFCISIESHFDAKIVKKFPGISCYEEKELVRVAYSLYDIGNFTRSIETNVCKYKKPSCR